MRADNNCPHPLSVHMNADIVSKNQYLHMWIAFSKIQYPHMQIAVLENAELYIYIH
jgi:hypothetical protein